MTTLRQRMINDMTVLEPAPGNPRVARVERSVNGYVEPRIYGERDLVRMGGPASAVAVNTQEIFSEDRR